MNILSAKDSGYFTKNFENVKAINECISIQKREIENLKLTELEIDFDNLFVCHFTKFFPSNGVIYPRLNAKLLKNSQPIDLQNSIEKTFALLRSTVHFTINSFVIDHDGYSVSNKQFVILDKFKNSLSSLSGGYIEDVFSIGPYKISNQATIFAPNSCKDNPEEQLKINTIPNEIKIIYYKNDVQKSVIEWVKENNFPFFSGISQDPDEPNYFYRIGNDKFVSSQNLMEKANIKFCSHDITPMAQVEQYIGKSYIFSTTPFLEIFLSNSNNAINNLKEYISSFLTSDLSLNANQKCFIKSYEKTLTLALEIFIKAKSIKEVQNRFNLDGELISKFDYQLDLNRIIENQSTTHLLSNLSGLSFQAYYRQSCNTIVDSASKIKNPDHIKMLLKTLEDKFQLNFCVEIHNEEHYIVLKGINIEENARKIWEIS